MSILHGVRGVYTRELLVLKTRFFRSLVSSLVSPALFLLAFGYGIGRYQTIGGARYIDFLFAGLIAMSTLNSAYGITTEINISRFYFKTFDEYLIAPIRRWEIVVGEVLYGLTKGSIIASVLVIYALIAGIDLKVSMTFIFVILLHMTAFALMGFIVALKMKTHGDQFAINAFIITPMTFLSGVFFPVDQMPKVIKIIVQIFPLTHSVILIRGALSGSGLDMLRLGILSVFVLILFMYATRLAGRSEG